MRKILLIDGDKVQIKDISRLLDENHFDSVSFEEPQSAITYLQRNPSYINLVILDFSIKQKEGDSTCMKLREVAEDIPIIVLSNKTDIDSKILAFKNGADDYIIKPFENAELIARVNAILRRITHIQTDLIVIGAVRLDDSAVSVSVNNKVIELTPLEFKLLRLLMRNGSTVTKREDILQQIWDVKGYEIMSNSIDVHINKLRTKLSQHGVNDFIQTQRGFGYKIGI